MLKRYYSEEASIISFLERSKLLQPFFDFNEGKMSFDGFLSQHKEYLTKLVLGDYVLTKTKLMAAKKIFRDHYAVGSGSDFAQPLNAKWKTIKDFITNEGYNSDSTVLHLIHRYHTDGYWYLTIEICSITDPVHLPHPVLVGDYPIAHQNIFFHVTPAGFSSNVVFKTGLSLTLPYYCENYFQFVQCTEGAGFESLDPTNTYHVKGTLICWKELRVLYQENKNENDDEQLVDLCFTSISDDCSSSPGSHSMVSFPHSIAIHSEYDDFPGVKDGNVIALGLPLSLQNRAADYQTLCPPSCNLYHWPAVFNQITT